MPVVWTNPITNDEFDTHEKYIQSLLDKLAEAKAEMWRWAQDERALVQALDEAAGKVEIKIGMVIAEGTQQRAKVTRKQNSKYPRPRGDQHPLRALLGKHTALVELIRVDYEESGSKITQLLERLHTNMLRPEDDRELAEDLDKVRETTSGKPSILIEDRPDATDGPKPLSDDSPNDLY